MVNAKNGQRGKQCMFIGYDIYHDVEFITSGTLEQIMYMIPAPWFVLNVTTI